MDTMFENLDFRFDKENNDERPFMIACIRIRQGLCGLSCSVCHI